MNSHHLIDIKDLSKAQIENLLQQGKELATHHDVHILDKISIANLFFEPSTRTRNSFSLAAMNLQAKLLNPNLAQSSINKGETDLDTVKCFAAMGVNILVIRHPAEGFAQQAAALVEPMGTCIINAGDGAGGHPTQALLDLYTIYDHFGDLWSKLQISIVGDIKRSRVARSFIDGLHTMGVKHIHVIAPPCFMPDTSSFQDEITCFDNLEKGISGSDVVMTLRVQHERPGVKDFDLDEYRQTFKINEKNLQTIKPEAIIMHPGPVNYDVEISKETASEPRSKIWQQVRHGVLIKMAILASIGLSL